MFYKLKFLKDYKRVFCKLIDGECGESVLLLQASDGKIWNGNKEIRIEDLKRIVSGGRYIIQSIVEQRKDYLYL